MNVSESSNITTYISARLQGVTQWQRLTWTERREI